MEESNELGSQWIERLIERQLLYHLNLPLSHQAVVLKKRYDEKDESYEMD
ncbi:hypothetical protein [Salipaludibacillus aurantiacus]|nr:hypothetical protein [Salipaludibacillus aurantiacus]